MNRHVSYSFYDTLLVGIKGRQNIVLDSFPIARTPYPYLDPREIRTPQVLYDRKHTLVPSRASRADDFYTPEGQVEVIMNQKCISDSYIKPVGTCPHRYATPVHEGHGAKKNKSFVQITGQDIFRLEATTGQSNSQIPAQQVNYFETDAVPCLFVFRPRIAETHDQIRLGTIIHPLPLGLLILRHVQLPPPRPVFPPLSRS